MDANLDGTIEMLEGELLRRQARSDLEAWCRHALKPFNQKPAAHHQLLIRHLERIASGECQRLLVCMPPGSAKSTYASVLFPAWFMTRPNVSVIAASHTADLAESFSRRVMGLIRDHADTLGYSLATESVSGWEAANGSRYAAVGVGGPVTGRRADVVLIDDPVKSRAMADSAVEREKVWNWYQSDLRSRLRPGARIVLIMTRWHEDDLGGRLLGSQSDRWTVLKLPAFAEVDDPLGREPGEPLWSDGPYGYAKELRSVLADYETTGGMRDWGALYQQNPRPLSGSLFKTAMISIVDAAPVGGQSVRAWDLAATKRIGTKNPDWTVGAKLKRLEDGRYLIEDIVRFRGDPADVEKAILNTASQDGKDVRISLPKDPGQAGIAQIQHLTSQLAGWLVESSPESGDKATRASPLASQVNVGNVVLLSGHFTAALLDEMAAFPSGHYDDQVDALSRAFNSLVPNIKSAGMLEIAKRHAQGSGLKVEEQRKTTFAPGSLEYERERLAEQSIEVNAAENAD